MQTQPLGEEVMVPEPSTPAVEGDHEQVLAVELFQDLLGIGDAGHGFAQGRGQPVEDRGVEQETPDSFGQAGQDLISQVVGHMPVVAGELVDEGAVIGLVPERQPDQLHPDGPAFCPLGEAVEIGLRQPDRHVVVEERGDVTRRRIGDRRSGSPAARPVRGGVPASMEDRDASR